MIFLVLFGLIAVIVISLNIYDNYNLEKIKTYLQNNNCQNIIYAKGSFKAICSDKIVQIDNAFSVDLEKRDELKIKNIKTIDKKSFSLLINNSFKIEFKEKKDLEDFYRDLEDIKNR